MKPAGFFVNRGRPLLRMALPLLVLAGLAGCTTLQKAARPTGDAFESEGCMLHYTMQGSGEAVVLLHGFAMNGDLNWRRNRVISTLSEHFQVIVPDLRGHGLSCKPHESGAYGINMAEDIIRLMDHVGIDRAHVAGYSLGGHITLKLAVEYPERLRTATIIAAGWDKNPQGDGPLQAATLVELLRTDNPFKALREHAGSSFQTSLISLLLRLGRDEDAMAGVLEGAGGLTVTEEELHGLSLPMHVIIGTRDPLYDYAQALRAEVSHVAWTVLDGAGHVDTPMRRRMLTALETFLLEQRQEPD